MAYGKLKNFAKTHKSAQDYLDEKMYFEAWIVYIRENERDPQLIVEDIDQEINRRMCPLTNEEKESLQVEAIDYLKMRKNE